MIEEGCLSLPGVLVEVERPIYVRVAARDERGDPLLIEASGLEARVIQHEIDHLDGVLILDRTPRDQRKQAMRTCASLREPARPRRLAGRAHRLPRHLRLRRRGARPSGRSPHRPVLVVTRPDRRGGRAAAPPPPVAVRRASSASSCPARAPARARGARADRRGATGGARRVRLRRADQGAAALGLRDVQRPSLAAAALARGGAGRARDHGRRQGTGVSIMRVTEGLDSGPVHLGRRPSPYGPEDDYATLAGGCGSAAGTCSSGRSTSARPSPSSPSPA